MSDMFGHVRLLADTHIHLSPVPHTAPKYPPATWNQTYDVKRDHVTGLVEVTYTLTLTSHWKSIAVLGSMEGLLIMRPRDSSHVAIAKVGYRVKVKVSVRECQLLLEWMLLGWM